MRSVMKKSWALIPSASTASENLLSTPLSLSDYLLYHLLSAIHSFDTFDISRPLVLFHLSQNLATYFVSFLSVPPSRFSVLAGLHRIP